MSDLQEIIESIALEDVLDREGVEYRIGHGSSGEQLNIQECPYCGGSSFKVYANRETGLGNCFHGSCGETFTLFGFTRQLLNLGNRETVEYLKNLASEMGWRPRARREIVAEVEENSEWKLPDSYALPTPSGQNLAYLLKRRVDNDTAAYFHLRYCLDGWYNYTKADGERGGMYFGERVLIPVYDLDGTMTTFQGRDLTGESDRKYLFPPGLPGTGRFLFNGQNVVGKRHVIVNEGAFDVIRTWINIKDTTHDGAGVVGTFGVDLSKGQDGNDQKNKFLRLKQAGLRRVTMFWDGEDKAFQKAIKAGLLLHSIGLDTWIARPPEGKDPGELTVEETKASLDAAVRLDRMSALRLRLGQG